MSLALCLEWGARRGQEGSKISNCDVRKGEEDTDPGIICLLKGSSEVRGPSGISLSVGGTSWEEEGAGQQWRVLAGGINFDGTVAPWPRKAQRAGATPQARMLRALQLTGGPPTPPGGPCTWDRLGYSAHEVQWSEPQTSCPSRVSSSVPRVTFSLGCLSFPILVSFWRSLLA